MRTHKALQKKSSVSQPFVSISYPLVSRPFAIQPKPNENPELQGTQGYKSQMPDFSIFNPEGEQLPLQPKLTIGVPGDQYEKEADQTAKLVVQRINAPVIAPLTLESSIQRRGGMEELEAPTNLESAITGARGSGQPLDTGLQEPMGTALGADFSGVRIHADAQADKLNRSIQARAFTTGQDVFFRQGEYQPGSRKGQELIAHELTHVVQQNGEAVQRSPKLENKLQPKSVTSVPGAKVVQRVGEEELKERGRQIEQMAENAPERGFNLWVLKNNGGEIHILGTNHGLFLSQMGEDKEDRKYLVKYLQSENFTKIYTETSINHKGAVVQKGLAENLEKKLEQQAIMNRFSSTPEAKEYKVALGRLTNLRSNLGGIDDLALDDAYALVAQSDSDGNKKTPAPVWERLETDEERDKAHEQVNKDIGVTGKEDETYWLKKPKPSEVTGTEGTSKGNQKELFLEVANFMKQGRDIAAGEERNKMWVGKIADQDMTKEKQLWIVGAAHIPGLILRLRDLGWNSEHKYKPIEQETVD